jgi:hypothetical protein
MVDMNGNIVVIVEYEWKYDVALSYSSVIL